MRGARSGRRPRGETRDVYGGHERARVRIEGTEGLIASDWGRAGSVLGVGVRGANEYVAIMGWAGGRRELVRVAKTQLCVLRCGAHNFYEPIVSIRGVRIYRHSVNGYWQLGDTYRGQQFADGGIIMMNLLFRGERSIFIHTTNY